MRIAHVTDCYLPRLGGIELQVHDLATRQAELGHEVVVVTSTAGPGISGMAIDSRVRVVRAGRGRGAAEKIRYRRTVGGLRAFMAELDTFDAVHVHASSFSPLVFLAAHHASRRGVPTVATVHSLWAKATPLFRAADGLTRWGAWPVAWSAVSNAAAVPLRRIVGDRAAVAVLPNGVDQDGWSVDPASDPALGGGELRIAVVSRLARRKRVLPLLEILAAAQDRLGGSVRFEVEILGDGPKRKDIERFLERHGMTGWVHLRGRRTRADIREVFARSDLFVAPARLESFGIAALEARCAGLPVLALSGTGVADFVAHGQEGWLAESDAAMVEALVSLARSPSALARVKEHNRSVPAAVSWPGVLAGCEALYSQASARHGRLWEPRVTPVLAGVADRSRPSRGAAAGGRRQADGSRRLGGRSNRVRSER